MEFFGPMGYLLNCRNIQRSLHLDSLWFLADLAKATVTFSRCKQKRAEKQGMKSSNRNGFKTGVSDIFSVGKAFKTKMGHSLKHTDLREDGSIKPRDGRLIHISSILLSLGSVIHRPHYSQNKVWERELQ